MSERDPLARSSGLHTTAILLAGLAGAISACHPPEPEDVQVRQSALVTPTFIQQNSAVPQSSPTSVAVAFTGAETAGDLNVVIIGSNNATSSVNSVTDTNGNTYQLAIGPNRTANISQSIYYAKNVAAAAAGSNTVTVVFDTAAFAPDLRILEYRGVDKVNPVDVTKAATGTSRSSSEAVTTTSRTDLLVAGNTVETSTTGAGTGYTRRADHRPRRRHRRGSGGDHGRQIEVSSVSHLI